MENKLTKIMYWSNKLLFHTNVWAWRDWQQTRADPEVVSLHAAVSQLKSIFLYFNALKTFFCGKYVFTLYRLTFIKVWFINWLCCWWHLILPMIWLFPANPWEMVTGRSFGPISGRGALFRTVFIGSFPDGTAWPTIWHIHTKVSRIKTIFIFNIQ